MSFFDENIKNHFDSLPESIKSKIELNAENIKSAEELNELVRRIRSAETGRIF